MDALNQTEDRWTFGSIRSSIDDQKEVLVSYSQYQIAYEEGLKLKEEERLEEARNKLNTIATDFPKYEEVKKVLDDVQLKIEDNIKEEARIKEEEAQKAAEAEKQRAAAAKAEAARQAKAAAEAEARAAADKAAAEAQAQAAAAQKAQAQAQAAAAAQAAAEAEARAQALQNAQTEAYINKWKKAVEYTTNGHSYMSKGISYAADGSYTAATSAFIYALDDYTAAKNVLGSDYIPEMATSHYYFQKALDSYINYEKYMFDSIYYLSTDYLDKAIDYKNQGDTYMDLAYDYIGKY